MSDNMSYPVLLEKLSETEQLPAWAQIAKSHLMSTETVAGTVSSKVEEIRRWGFFNIKCCECAYIKDGEMTMLSPDASWHKQRLPLLEDGYVEYPRKRCARHRGQLKRWQNAKRVFVRLDELRMNEDLEHLRFVTLTRSEWNILVPMAELHNIIHIQEKHKQKCTRSFRNWRDRNDWWQATGALGQFWPECKHNAEWNGVEFVGIRLHFHVHCIIVSKYLDNRPVRDCCERACNCPKDMQGEVINNSRFFKEWKGIVDVRSVKDYKNPYNVKGETRYGCGRKACMRYLSKYITKAEHWRSVKIGKW